MINSRRTLTVKFAATSRLDQMRTVVDGVVHEISKAITSQQPTEDADCSKVEVYVVDNWREGIFKFNGRGPLVVHAEIGAKAIETIYEDIKKMLVKFPFILDVTLTTTRRR